jgi:hypothetical protein
MPGLDIRSQIVVVSWWSNCLGLACLARLAQYASQRELIYVQVGKSKESQERFRRLAPRQARERLYPEGAPAEHSRVIQAIALGEMCAEYGVWFVDHDFLAGADMGSWLDTADELFSQFPICLCTAAGDYKQAITQPLFWLSPARWPEGTPGIDPVPFQARPSARRPGLYRHRGEMQIPLKDTLVKAYEELAGKGLVGEIAGGCRRRAGLPPAPVRLPRLPAHTHLGGLYLLAGPVLPGAYQEWMRATVRKFRAFFAACPPDWLQAEDPELLGRLREFEGALDV